MNIVSTLLLAFAFIGLIDKMLGSKAGLSQAFDKGLLTMGTMSVSIIGVSCIGVEFIERNFQSIMPYLTMLPFDPSLIGGMLLASDMGGFSISNQLTSNPRMLIINGVILSSLFGQFVTFQLPVFNAASNKEDMPVILKGFIIGVIVIPAGLIISGFILKMSLLKIITQLTPVFIICISLAIALVKIPDFVLSAFNIFTKIIQFFIYALFLLTVLGVFIPKLAYSDMESIREILIVILKSTMIICGSMVLCELILKFFQSKLQVLAYKLKINEVSVIAMLLNCSTSLAILPLLSKMDNKGKMLNASFSVSGAYFVGGQLGFVSSVTNSSTVTIYIIAKVLCGFLSMLLVYIFYDKLYAL